MRPTRLEGWNVHALVAHHAMFVRALSTLAARPVDGPPTVPTARDMLRGFNALGGNAHTLAPAVADLARTQADAHRPDALVERFAVDAPTTLDTVRAAGPVVVDYFGNGTFPITEVLAIGILEAVVHGLDLVRAVDATPDLPDAAVGFTVALLARLADPVEFVEAATGRGAAPVLPLLR
jgi:uncharacterized protein (TIGR03083 family)